MGCIQLDVGTIDLDRAVVMRDGEAIALTGREVEVLRYLSEHAHGDVPREDLLVHVWRVPASQDTRAVDTAMRRLRLKIERDPGSPVHLITVHGVGYRFVPRAGPERHAPPVRRESSRLIGRDELLAHLRARLQAGARLLTLTGPPGIGKTRLSQELAIAVASDFPGGVYPVALARVDTLPAIVRALGNAVGVPLTERVELEVLIERLGAAIAGRGRLLLVLDNVEQVVDLTAGTVGAWLEAAPQVSVVVTSRARLGVPVEEVVAVAPLGEDDAVTLFVDRAARIRPGYRPSQAERVQIAEIARRLDGLPLAIELAAARTNVLGPRQILDRLQARFRLLTGRGAALRASIDQSWDLLDDRLRAVLAATSVFAGGFDAPAARAVLGEDAIVALEELSRRSLVLRAGARYDLLESLRVYASEKLDGEAREEAIDRHAAHYEQLGEELSELVEEHGGRERLDRLERELDNLLAAQRRMLDRDPVRAATLTQAALTVLQSRGPFGLALELVDAVLACELPLDVRCRILDVRAYTRRRLGRITEALADFEEAIALAEQVGDRRLEAITRGNLANLFVERGEPLRARPLMEQALAIHREEGSRRAEGVVLGDLAVITKLQGQMEAARRQYEEALAIHREVGNRIGEGLVTGNLAILHAEIGDLVRAEELLVASLALHREMGNRRPEAVTLANLGQLLEHRGDLEGAERCLEESLELNRRMGNRRLVAIVLGNLAGLDLRCNRLAAAEARLDEAIGLNHEIGNLRDEGTLRGVLAGVRWRQGRLVEAEALYLHALRLYEHAAGAESRAARDRAYLAALRATRGAVDEAEALLCRSAEVLGAESGFLHMLRGVLDVGRAWIAERKGDDPAPHLASARSRLARQFRSTENDVGRAREVLQSTLELYEQGLLRP